MADNDSTTGYHPLSAYECRYLKDGFLADKKKRGHEGPLKKLIHEIVRDHSR